MTLIIEQGTSTQTDDRPPAPEGAHTTFVGDNPIIVFASAIDAFARASTEKALTTSAPLESSPKNPR